MPGGEIMSPVSKLVHTVRVLGMTDMSISPEDNGVDLGGLSYLYTSHCQNQDATGKIARSL